MIQSMTGFGRAETEFNQFRIVCEIKSVNHRFKDFRYRSPSTLNRLEVEIKKMIGQHLKRGSFDISIHLKKSKDTDSVKDVDFKKVNSYLSQFSKQVASHDVSYQVNVTDFLRPEFLVDLDDNEDEIIKSATETFSKALEELKKSRLEEGKKLEQIMTAHLESYEKNFEIVKGCAKKIRSALEEKLFNRLEEYKTHMPVDEPRFMQEVLFYLEKLDIDEEINRIESHLEKIKSLFEQEEIGRQFEFTLQELGRETNTIGSKSSSVDLSGTVVKMKVDLEKLREQGLNIQ